MPALPTTTPDSSTGHRPHLLVVDDLAELRLIIKLTCSRGGLDVTSCADVPAAWEALHQRRPDLVLLDMNLPGLHGLELFRRIQASPEHQGLRVALFGHYDLTADVARAVEAGIRFVVSKELISQPAEWLQRVREILAVPDSQPPPGSLGCEGGGGSPHPPAHWKTLVQQALRQGPVRRLGPAVLQVVLRQSLRDAWACCPPAGGMPPGDPPDTWLLADGSPRPEDPLQSAVAPESVTAFVTALADRIWCLLGSQASRPFRAALAALVPALSEDVANE
jgi:CheY-like chemotaxis protein